MILPKIFHLKHTISQCLLLLINGLNIHMTYKIIADKKLSEKMFYTGDYVQIKHNGKYITEKILDSKTDRHLIKTPTGEKWFHSLELEYHNPFKVGQKVKVFSKTSSMFHEGIVKDIRDGKCEVHWDYEGHKYKKVAIDKLKEWNPVFHNIHHLFQNGAVEGSIKQGTIGNCYFLAVYEGIFRAGIAYKILPKMIREVSPYTWEVTFFDPRQNDSSGNMGTIKTNIHITDLFTTDHKLQEGRIGDLLLERTFGKAIVEIESRWLRVQPSENDDMNDEPHTMVLAESGSIQNAIKILLGRKPKNVFSPNIDTLRKNLDNYSAFIGERMIIAGSSTTPTSSKIVPKHAYFIQSYLQETDEVVLINPHDTNKGILVLSLQEFINNFHKAWAVDLSNIR